MLARFQVALFFLYGIVLVLWALYLAGGGHGSFLLFDVASAPFLVPGLQYGAFLAPFQWGILAILLRHWRHGATFAIAFLILHYADAGFALHFRLDPEDSNFGRLDGMLPGFTIYLVAGFLWYLGGQILLWIIALKGISAMRKA